MILVMFLNSEERRSVSVRGARGSPVWPSEKTSCELRQEPGSPGPRTREKNDNNIAHEDIYTGRDKKLVALFSVLFSSPFTLIIDCCVVVLIKTSYPQRLWRKFWDCVTASFFTPFIMIHDIVLTEDCAIHYSALLVTTPRVTHVTCNA